MRRAAATIVACLSLALPAAALGQEPAAPAPPPAPGALSLKLERVHRVGRDDVVLRGDRVRVRGVVAPYVPGQAVVVRVYQGRKKLAAKAAAIRPIRGGRRGALSSR